MHGVLEPGRADGLCYRSLVELLPDAVWITSSGKVIFLAASCCDEIQGFARHRVLLIANILVAGPLLLNEECFCETIPYILAHFRKSGRWRDERCCIY